MSEDDPLNERDLFGNDHGDWSDVGPFFIAFVCVVAIIIAAVWFFAS